MLICTKKFVWVTFQRKGFHYYPNAPEEVAYLKDRHRHLFKFKVKMEVFSDDREIEFHMMLNLIESWYDSGSLELNYKSCEMLANDLANRLFYHYGSKGNKRECQIDISEDGECGCEAFFVIPG
jgi:hypothetical protein